MGLPADLSQRVVIDTGDLAWSPSPMAGVKRRMLDRLGAEVAQTTSIVRSVQLLDAPGRLLRVLLLDR